MARVPLLKPSSVRRPAAMILAVLPSLYAICRVGKAVEELHPGNQRRPGEGSAVTYLLFFAAFFFEADFLVAVFFDAFFGAVFLAAFAMFSPLCCDRTYIRGYKRSLGMSELCTSERNQVL
jgi:hypothetical protein